MEGIIDRFEGDYAVIETGDMKMMNILKEKISPKARPGDYVVEKNGFFEVDKQKTDELKEKIKKLMDQAFE